MSDRDAVALADWLTARWDRPVDVELLGQSTAGARRRNLLLEATSPGHDPRRLVATVLPTRDIAILSMADEAGVRQVARDQGVPVPEIVGVELDESVLGGEFFVSELIDGETIPRRVLRLVERHAMGEQVVAQLGQAFADLHRADPADVPERVAHPDRPVEAALDGVRVAVADMLQPEPAFSYGIRWLDAHRPPEPEHHALVHADVRTGNIIVDDTGLAAILDWETAKVGDPMEDLAWVCTRMWRFGLDHLTVGGLGTVPTLRDAYVAAGGTWDDDRFRWWRALTTLRWGLGLAGQAAAHLDGTYRTVVMAASGRRVTEMAFDLLTLVEPD